MTTWVIGDIQGCCSTLEVLLDRIDFSPGRDRIVLVGDIVNRGPRSLDALTWVWRNRSSVSTVLGNHDLHLLMRSLDLVPGHRRDTLDGILHSPDAPALLDWLREQPLLLHLGDDIVVHAGLHPTWTHDDAVRLSDALTERLQRPDWGAFLQGWRAWRGRDPGTAGSSDEDLYGALNVLTRMRALESDGSLDDGYTGRLQDLEPPLRAWFEVPREAPLPGRVLFGHWAALGHHVHGPFVALDSGCVWGRGLTAYAPENDVAVFQQAVD